MNGECVGVGEYIDKDLERTLNGVIEDKKIGYPWLKEKIILLGPTGSGAYGTNIDGISDKDFRGICIPPKDWFLGLKQFNEYNNVGGKSFKTKVNEVDISIVHISKFMKEALKGVPNNIELLFLRREDYVVMTELGQKLTDNRHLFLSRAMAVKYDNYADTQIHLLNIKKSNGTGRLDLVEKFGYDCKFFGHAVRLLTSVIEILETGDFTTYRPNREFLKACKTGKYSLEEAQELINRLKMDVRIAYEKSTLPDYPDRNGIEKLMIELTEMALYDTRK